MKKDATSALPVTIQSATKIAGKEWTINYVFYFKPEVEICG